MTTTPEELTADFDAGPLTADERMILAYAVNAHTNYPVPRGVNDLSGVRNPVEVMVEALLRSRVTPGLGVAE